MKIITCGDSHSSWTFGKPTNPKDWSDTYQYEEFLVEVKWLGPKTMHGINKDIPNFDVYITSDKDLLFLFFGEIDCRYHIADQMRKYNRNPEEITNTLSNKFIENLLTQKHIDQIIVCAIPPTCNNDLVNLTDRDCLGTNQERKSYVDMLNNKLENLCKIHKIKFINLYEGYADENGLLIYSLSDGFNHIAKREIIYENLRNWLKENNLT